MQYPTYVSLLRKVNPELMLSAVNIESKLSVLHTSINSDLPSLEFRTTWSMASLLPSTFLCQLAHLSKTSEVGRFTHVPADKLTAYNAVSVMDLGFVTHAIHMNTRLVSLVPSSLSADGQSLAIEGPPSEQIHPPGPGWLYVLVNGVPSEGTKVMVGSGADPPVDEEAIQNLLEHTQAIAYQKVSKHHSS